MIVCFGTAGVRFMNTDLCSAGHILFGPRCWLTIQLGEPK